MKRITIAALLVVAILIAALAAYCTTVVTTPRRETPAIVEEVVSSNRIKLRLEDFPPERLEMLLAVQDPAFYTHHGMDLSTPGAGLTTLTQALVKTLYFDRFKPGLAAKLRQTLIAVFALDPLVSKDTQLLLFINLVGLGGGGVEIQGFADAAEAYFDKSFRDLTEDEYLALVAMMIAPNGLNVEREPALNAKRVKYIKRFLSGDYKPQGLMDLYYDSDPRS